MAAVGAVAAMASAGAKGAAVSPAASAAGAAASVASSPASATRLRGQPGLVADMGMGASGSIWIRAAYGVSGSASGGVSNGSRRSADSLWCEFSPPIIELQQPAKQTVAILLLAGWPSPC